MLDDQIKRGEWGKVVDSILESSLSPCRICGRKDERYTDKAKGYLLRLIQDEVVTAYHAGMRTAAQIYEPRQRHSMLEFFKKWTA